MDTLRERRLTSCRVLPLVNDYSNIEQIIKCEEIELEVKSECELDDGDASNVPEANSESLLRTLLENGTKAFRRKRKKKTPVLRNAIKKVTGR